MLEWLGFFRRIWKLMLFDTACVCDGFYPGLLYEPNRPYAVIP